MKQASIFLVMVLTLGLASCSQGTFGGGDTLFGSLLASEKAEEEKSSQPKNTDLARKETRKRPQRIARREDRRPVERNVSRPKSSGSKVLAGGIAKSRIGRQLDSADLNAAGKAEYRALEFSKPGVATPWRNPRNGKYGSVVASDEFRQNNIYCRKYTHTVYINGRPNVLRGFACRNRDGSWEKLG